MSNIRFLALILVVLLITSSCSTTSKLNFTSKGKIDYKLTKEDNEMLDSIQRLTFQYFLHEHHPEKGIVKDRALAGAPSSIAATGFGLPCFAIAVERNWMSRENAAEITLKTLQFFADSPQNDHPNSTGFKGFYYHFLKMDNGLREWNCELSSIDTGLLMMGVIFARNYYNGNSDTEKQIRKLSDFLLARLDWDFFYLPDTAKHPHTLSMGWKPEEGLLNFGWHGYNEGLFLYIMAAGTGWEKAEKSFDAWLSTYKWKTPYEGLSHVAFPPLFGHQFSHAFIDFRGLGDKYMKNKGIDYFENSRRATLVQQKYAIENPYGHIGYDSLCWGVTASDGPGEAFNFGDKKFIGYAGRGTSGPDYNYYDDGTIAPYGPLSSLPFEPALVLATTRSMLDRYGHKIWGKYGFYDAFNLTANWVDNDFIGIDQGPMLIMIENFRSGMVWNYVMKDPIIQKGLNRLGFEYMNSDNK